MLPRNVYKDRVPFYPAEGGTEFVQNSGKSVRLHEVSFQNTVIFVVFIPL
jgi:hypothetical protein